MERNSEYDAFGPWIFEIEEEHEIPRLFRDCYNEADHIMLFKMPRSIERRNASPYMDLYDYLIGAYETHIHIYKRVGKRTAEYIINYNDIFAVKDIHALLKGELILFTHQGPIVIGYNTVSEEIIMKFIKVIGEKISAGSRTLQMESLPVYYSQDESSLDILFFNLFDKVQEIYPRLNLIAYQPKLNIQRTRRLRKKIADTKLALSGTAFFTNDNELIVMERNMPKGKRDKEEHEYSYLYIPFKKIRGASYSEFYSDQGLYVMVLKVMELTFSYIIDNYNRNIFELCNKLYDFNYLQ